MVCLCLSVVLCVCASGTRVNNHAITRALCMHVCVRCIDKVYAQQGALSGPFLLRKYVCECPAGHTYMDTTVYKHELNTKDVYVLRGDARIHSDVHICSIMCALCRDSTFAVVCSANMHTNKDMCMHIRISFAVPCGTNTSCTYAHYIVTHASAL